jgi:hypothetical protein
MARLGGVLYLAPSRRSAPARYLRDISVSPTKKLLAGRGAPGENQGDMPMTPTPNPWQPPLAPELATLGPVYGRLMQALHAASRSDPELTTVAALVTAVELTSELMIQSGALWGKPDLIACLRDHIDHLEQRRDSEAPPETSAPTLREFFANARPAAAN